MHYAKIDKCEYTNGIGCGISLYVSGCHFHCKGCFNSEAWDFNYGQLWNRRTMIQFLDLTNHDYVKRVSILGGEPLAYENLPDVYDIIKKVREEFPKKDIWLWTGNELSVSDFDASVDVGWDNDLLRNHILAMCNYVVDGKFVEDLKDLTLPFRGSTNQRIIDVKETIRCKEIVTI